LRASPASSERDGTGRDGAGQLRGFQRPQIAGHINEIRDYLEKPGAILPNPIVIGFTDSAIIETGTAIKGKRGRIGVLTIDVSGGAPGWIVDGQQRSQFLITKTIALTIRRSSTRAIPCESGKNRSIRRI
jgi:DGQHR domain-containing protein